MRRFLLPLIAFVGLAGFLGYGLSRPKDDTLPSPLISRAAPNFSLQVLDGPAQPFSPKDLAGRVWVLNAWASWCAPCVQEMPVLAALGREAGVPIVGLNYKDKPDAARRMLTKVNPYHVTLLDSDGRVGLDYGVYGLPETFVIDAKGAVRYKHTGPLDAQQAREKLLPVLRQLAKG
jgi:cytochrome c biogenesis protein CcmG/thiol:disulfide interchange protein DsbE